MWSDMQVQNTLSQKIWVSIWVRINSFLKSYWNALAKIYNLKCMQIKVETFGAKFVWETEDSKVSPLSKQH